MLQTEEQERSSAEMLETATAAAAAAPLTICLIPMLTLPSRQIFDLHDSLPSAASTSLVVVLTCSDLPTPPPLLENDDKTQPPTQIVRVDEHSIHTVCSVFG